ncbi:hypothetical protein GCM10027047_11610 [Rhodococcus aerolatus]
MSSPWTQPSADLTIATSVWQAARAHGESTQTQLAALFDGLVALETELRGTGTTSGDAGADGDLTDPSDPLATS